MTFRLIFSTIVSVTLISGCARIADSRVNPLNWFAQTEEETTVTEPIIVEDPRPLIPEVTALSVERTPGGAIVRATGLPPTQGWHSGTLVAVSEGPVDGVLSYAFRVVPPEGVTQSVTRQSRELTSAVFVSNGTLAQTRVIRVVGARNAQSVRR